MAKHRDHARPEFTDANRRARNVSVMHPDDAWHLGHWYEAPRENPASPEIYVYTDELSFSHGEDVAFRASCTGESWTLQIWRDGERCRASTNLSAADNHDGRFWSLR